MGVGLSCLIVVKMAEVGLYMFISITVSISLVLCSFHSFPHFPILHGGIIGNTTAQDHSVSNLKGYVYYWSGLFGDSIQLDVSCQWGRKADVWQLKELVGKVLLNEVCLIMCGCIFLPALI